MLNVSQSNTKSSLNESNDIIYFHSHISGVTLLGVPAEVYSNGTQYLIIGVINVLIIVTVITVFLPVFYELQLTSVYEVYTYNNATILHVNHLKSNFSIWNVGSIPTSEHYRH